MTARALLIFIFFGFTRFIAANTHIVLAGGFGSCPWEGHPRELNMWPYLKKQLSKLSSENLNYNLNNHLVTRICYSLTDNVVIFETLKHTDNNSFVSLNTKVQTPSKFIKSFENLLLENETQRLLLIGQSLGGDLMLDLAISLTKRNEPLVPTIDVQLVTIDPISRVNCPPYLFLYGLISQYRGCREFPKKPSEALNGLAERSSNWSHFYQTDFPFLHSGPSTHSHSSTKLDYSKQFTLNPFGAHALTENDKQIWKFIYLMLEEAYIH